MKLKAQIIPAWGVEIIGTFVLLVSLPVLIVLAAIFGAVWVKRRAVGPGRRWSRWFAWYPVRVEFNDHRWLETVERRSIGILADTRYRAIDRGAA